jgi:hypothetical protein
VAKEHAQVVKFTTRWVEGIRALLRAWELGKQAGDDQRQLLQQRLAEEKYEGNTDFSWKCGILQAHSANEAHSVKQKEALMEAEGEGDGAGQVSAAGQVSDKAGSPAQVCRTCTFATLITLLCDINV